jgi:hypothetical protein
MLRLLLLLLLLVAVGTLTSIVCVHQVYRLAMLLFDTLHTASTNSLLGVISIGLQKSVALAIA